MRERVRAAAKRLLRSRRGAIMPEFALAMPVMLILLLGGMEISRYVLLNQKLDRVAATLGDLVAQAETITTTDLDNLFNAAGFVAAPFEMGDNGVVVVSGVGVVGSQTRVLWQRAGGGSLPATSDIGVTGATAALPDGLTVDVGRTLVVAEVYYTYTPWIMGGLTQASTLYHRAFFRPRYGSLDTLG